MLCHTSTPFQPPLPNHLPNHPLHTPQPSSNTHHIHLPPITPTAHYSSVTHPLIHNTHHEPHRTHHPPHPSLIYPPHTPRQTTQHTPRPLPVRPSPRPSPTLVVHYPPSPRCLPLSSPGLHSLVTRLAFESH